MQLKTKFRRPLFTLIIAAGPLFLIIIFFTLYILGWNFYGRPVVSSSNSQASQNQADIQPVKPVSDSTITEPTNPGLPVRLIIPKVDIDTTIKHMGLSPEGAVDTPESQNEAGWFNSGPRPGERGSAIIAGHYGWKDGSPSVFDKLYQLRKGDKLFVKDDKGVIISFVVRENRRYDPNAEASEVFKSNDGKPHLNLITCEGTWDEVSKSYSSRLVVFTDKVD